MQEVSLWWMVFFTSTLILMLITKSMNVKTISYFIMSEFLSFLFILSPHFSWSGMILSMKMGLGPFYLWVFPLLQGNWSKMALLWILFLSKAPMAGPFLSTLSRENILLLFMGSLMILIHLAYSKSEKNIMLLNSSESSTLLFILAHFAPHSFITLMALYIALLLSLLGGSSMSAQSLEGALYFMGFPISGAFILKLMLFSTMSSEYFASLLFLPFMSLGVLGGFSLSLLIFMNKSSKQGKSMLMEALPLMITLVILLL